MKMSAVDPAFALKLARFIRCSFTTGGCDFDRIDELAKKCKVLAKDLLDWARGEAAPSPMKKKEILDYLNSQTGRA